MSCTQMSRLETFIMAPTKFSDAQIAILESAFKNGLRSTRMDLNGDEIISLASRAELAVEHVKVWINNRKRKDRRNRPTSGLLASEAQELEMNQGIASPMLLKAPTHRRPSGWNVFCSRALKSELRNAPKELKMKMAHDMYEKLNEAEKEALSAEAKALDNAKLEDLDEAQIDKSITCSMQRTLKEMQYLEQFNAVGFCLVMKPNGKLVSAATLQGEGFLSSECDIARKFSEYCDVPANRIYSKTEVRLFLNKEYSTAVGEPSRVPYKQFGQTFVVEGWPEAVPFKTPARMGPTQLKRVMEVKDSIKFNLIGQLPKLPAITSNTNDVAICHHRLDQEDDVATNVDAGAAESEEALQPAQKKARGKKASCVKKGDIVPVYAPVRSDDEDDIGYTFWLFLCNGKVRTDETLLGKWLTQTEEDRTFVVLGQRRSIFEANILAFNNRRVILNDSHFEEKTDGRYRLTEATCEWLQDISSGAFDST